MNCSPPKPPSHVPMLTQCPVLKAVDSPQWTSMAVTCPGHNRFPPEHLPFSPASSEFPILSSTHVPFTCQYTFTFVLELGFNFSYKPHWWNNVHILLFDRPKSNCKEHIILKMLKTYHSHVTLCSVVHPRILQFSENIFGKYYYVSFTVKETDTEKAKSFASSYRVSQGRAEIVTWASRSQQMCPLRGWMLSIFSPTTAHFWNAPPPPI